MIVQDKSKDQKELELYQVAKPKKRRTEIDQSQVTKPKKRHPEIDQSQVAKPINQNFLSCQEMKQHCYRRNTYTRINMW